MGTRIFFVIMVFGLCAPIYGTLVPIDISQMIQPVFNFNNSQLNTISKDLASYFNLPTYATLNQSTLTTALARLTSVSSINIFNPTIFARFVNDVETALQNTGVCALCQIVVALFQLDDNFLPIILEVVCTIYMTLATQSVSNFCSGLIDLNLPPLKFVKKNSKIMDPQLVCTIILQNNQCRFSKPALSWTSTVSTSPKILPVGTANTSLTPLKVIHLSDFHISMNYKENSSADCGYPVCCLDGLGNVQKGGKAGRWGDYYCDVAPSMFTAALKHISATHADASFIVYTGDIVDHAIWNTTIASNLETINFAYGSLKQSFPNIPVFPSIGNHESQPMNMFAPIGDQKVLAAGLDQGWLYREVATLWSSWLSASALENLKTYGYYAHNYSTSLKIIGMNSNLCYIYNWYLWYNMSSLEDHLNWLNDELAESEQNGQFVYIVGHNSMGNGECVEPWEISYHRIKVRFSHIIVGDFVGHTHTDELKITYDGQVAVSAAFNGASLTTFQFFNPNYKVMHVRPDTWEIVDIDTYIFNMTEANLTPNQEPSWYKLYSMRDAYNLPDLSPKSLDALCDAMATNTTLRNQYWQYYVRDGDASLETGCDDVCQHEIHCKIPKTLSYQQTKAYCMI